MSKIVGGVVRLATLVFYALASFFLGVIAVQNGAALSAALGLSPSLQSPVETLLIVLTIAGPLFFLALAGYLLILGDAGPDVQVVAQAKPEPEPEPDNSAITEALAWLDVPTKPDQRR